MLPSQQQRLSARRHQLPAMLRLDALSPSPSHDPSPHQQAALRELLIEPEPSATWPQGDPPSTASTPLPVPMPTLHAVAEAIRTSPLASPPILSATDVLEPALSRWVVTPQTPSSATHAPMPQPIRRSSLRRRTSDPKSNEEVAAGRAAEANAAKKVRFAADSLRPAAQPPWLFAACAITGASAALNGVHASQAWLEAASTVWTQQALFALPTILGPVALIRPSSSDAARCIALVALGATLGILLASLLQHPSLQAPILDTTPCVFALALSVQTGRRAWRERHSHWPSRPLARVLRATLPLQIAGPSAYVWMRTQAAADAVIRHGTMPMPWLPPTSMGAEWEACCISIAALTTAAMLLDGHTKRAQRIHRRRGGTGGAMLAAAILSAAALLQASVLWRRAARSGRVTGLI